MECSTAPVDSKRVSETRDGPSWFSAGTISRKNRRTSSIGLAPQSVASELSADLAKRQRAPAPHRRFTEAGYFLAEPCKLYV